MVYTDTEPKTFTDKTTIPGYVYLMDDGRDLKLGITRNINNRLNHYITENPQLTCHGFFQADSLEHAEQIERELIELTRGHRTHGKEWCKHCDEVFQIWNKIHRKYSKLTYDEWVRASRNYKLNQSLKIVASKSRNRFAGLRRDNKDPTFSFKGFKDIVLCDRTWFDGSSKTARTNLFEHCRKYMQDNSTKSCHWEGEDFVVVEKGFFNRINPEPVQHRESQGGINAEQIGIFACAITFLILMVLGGISHSL